VPSAHSFERRDGGLSAVNHAELDGRQDAVRLQIV
jgi:hypothetical protein